MVILKRSSLTSAVLLTIVMAILYLSMLETSKIVDLSRISSDSKTKSGGGLHRKRSNQVACEAGPRRNVFFLKTHKTGSSTLQNILVRYAWSQGLHVGIPRSDILFGYYNGETFKKTQIQPLPYGKTVNFLTHHMVFDYKQVKSVMPENSVYFTILRNPATHFESVFKYFSGEVSAFEMASLDGGLTQYMKDPNVYFHGRDDGQFWWFAKNGMFFDLGFDNMNEDLDYIRSSIEKINDNFDLVLLAEYFDISLLLLNEILCWDLRDLVYLTMNARNHSSVEHVTDDVKNRILDWNKADAMMYDFFNKTFWRRVEYYGQNRLENNLQKLQILKRDIAEHCIQSNAVSNADISDNKFRMFNPKGIEVTQYRLNKHSKFNETCKGLILPEVEWWKRLRSHQKLRPSLLDPYEPTFILL